VLSLFGLVPAALVGIDPAALLNSGARMAGRCRREDDNPALSLGTTLGEAARAGRDKMMLLLPETSRAFGLWVEQLVAESTGKAGRGPADRRRAGRHTDEYGADRLFAPPRTATLGGFTPAGLAALERANHAVKR
jgi:glucose-6-phosphate isomerase